MQTEPQEVIRTVANTGAGEMAQGRRGFVVPAGDPDSSPTPTEWPTTVTLVPGP